VTRVFRIYRLLLDISAVALAILMLAYLLSGYILLNPSRAGELIPLGYRLAIAIHRGFTTRVLLIAFSAVHGVAGFSLMALRIKSRLLRKLALLAIHGLFAALLAYIAVLEASLVWT